MSESQVEQDVLIPQHRVGRGFAVYRANGAEVNQPRASKAPPWVRRTRKYPAP